MNKTCRLKNNKFSFLCFACLILFNLPFFSACGLDTYYVINPPATIVHEPVYSSIDVSSHYFEFYTSESVYSGIKFLGTDVYYKIYRNATKMETEYKNIVATATNVDTAANAPSRMIDTYKFKTLETNVLAGNSVLIPAAGSNRKIKIRLSDSSPYNAEILVNDANIYGSADRVLPIRNITSVYGTPTFSFSQLPVNLRPKSDDPDVDYGSGNDNEWYVCMFAVAVAQDANYSQIYSNVLYLGSVKITVQ